MTEMPWGPTDVEGWEHTTLQLVRGNMPSGFIALVELGRPERFAAALSAVTWQRGSSRAASLQLLHRCLDAVCDVLIAPLAWGGLHLHGDGAAIAIELAGQRIWVGHLKERHDANPDQVLGEEIRRLLLPIVDLCGEHARVGRRGVDGLMRDGLRANCARMARSTGADLHVGWPRVLLAAATGTDDRTPTLTVQPDAGDAIELPVPNACCMDATSAGADACPMCPLRGDDATKASLTEQWIRGLDEGSFEYVVGRRRTVSVNTRN